MTALVAVAEISRHITNTSSRSQARWDSNTWALSLRSDFSPRVTAPYVGVRCYGESNAINDVFHISVSSTDHSATIVTNVSVH